MSHNLSSGSIFNAGHLGRISIAPGPSASNDKLKNIEFYKLKLINYQGKQGELTYVEHLALDQSSPC